MQKIFFLLILLQINFSYAFEDHINAVHINPYEKRTSIEWNGKAPFTISIKKTEFDLFIASKKTYIPLHKEFFKKTGEKTVCIFSLEDSEKLDLQAPAVLIIKNVKNHHSKKWKLIIKIHRPKLKILSQSQYINSGGAAVIVVKSEPSKDLALLAVRDQKNNLFYPFTLKKDGYYGIIFPSILGESISKCFDIVSVDYAGNYNILPITNLKYHPIAYKKSSVLLPKNYVEEKQKELNLDQKTLDHCNIKRISTAMQTQNCFNPYHSARINFKDAVKEVINEENLDIFWLETSPAMKNAVVTSGYGYKRLYFHENKLFKTSIHTGVDLASLKHSPIYAILRGKVIYRDWAQEYGKTLIIYHGLGVYSLYGHISEFLIEKNALVSSGKLIAKSGSTGQSTGDHLHLSLIIQGFFSHPEEWASIEKIKALLKPLREASKLID